MFWEADINKLIRLLQKEGGRVPRTIDVELTEDLVDTYVPGDVVTVTGIVKVNIYHKKIQYMDVYP